MDVMRSVQPSKEELLQNISPDMRLTPNFFLRIYGYEITWPGFAEQAIAALEIAGCSHARKYYDDCVAEYEMTYQEGMKRVSAWLVEECARRQKEKERRVMGAFAKNRNTSNQFAGFPEDW